MSTPNSNPTVETLVSFALGDLDSSQAAALEARLTRTPEARRLLDKIRELVRTLQTYDGVSPPDVLVRRVKGMVGAAPSAAAPALREFVATLVFDSFGKVALAGFRGTVADRQLAYSSDIADIDLQVSAPAPSRRAVRGQVSTAGAPGATSAALTRPGQADPVCQAEVDQHGMFSLESTPGTFELRITVGDSVVLVPGLDAE